MHVEQPSSVSRCQRSVIHIFRKPIIDFPGSLLRFLPRNVGFAVMLDGNAQALELLTVLPLVQVDLAKKYTLGHRELLASRLNSLIPSTEQLALEAICKLQK